MRPQQRIILYLEEDYASIHYARLDVQRHFSAWEFYSFRSCDTLEEAVTSGSVSVRDIGIFCADGILLARQTNRSSYGWEAVEFLQSQGYRGKALDISTSSIPAEKSNLFVSRGYKFGKEFVRLLEQYLPR